MPARSTPFVARDHFKVALGKKDKVKVAFVGNVGDAFHEWFLVGAGKIELPASVHGLAYYELTKRSRALSIVDELGGEALAETTLADIWAKMEAQGNGEENDLHTKNYAKNIFFVRDVAGVLREVIVDWRGDGWIVGASQVSTSYEWGAGCRVFVNNSVPVAV